jgi:hypothetical protein
MAGEPVGYFEAWALWWDGIDIKSRILGGLEIYWWARFAKIAALLGALAFLPDIIGLERLRAWLSALKKPVESTLMVVVGILCLVLPFSFLLLVVWMKPGPIGLLAIVLLPVGLGIGAYILDSFIKGTGRPVGAVATVLKLTEHTTFMQFVRITSLILLLAAFHFDFLAS